MSSARRYPKAPITEAIIEMRVQQAPGITVGDLLRCHIGEEKSYPGQKEIKVGVGHFEVGARLSATATAQPVGFLFTSGDQTQVYQARLDGFSMSKLAPYESWQPFRDEGRRLWNVYRQAVKPVRVERIAVRYINRLDIPGPRVELKDYLRTGPEIAEGLPQSLDGFFMQLQLPVQDIRGRLLLNETTIEPPSPGVVAVVLDIDLFRAEDLPQEEEGIWQLVETMRLRKNEFFEACITDRARELFT
ncbi:MAG TPA: TIGR04255 family protein [Gemmataceae bacterium]|jgi:uncharacterized protein (TIGR04255 family)|nr:TIGR04255 family protein [Gemmataceae bacterium]